MAKAHPKRFINALYALELENDVEPIAGLHAPDADISNPLVQHQHKGVDGARDFWRTYRDSFQTIKSEFHNIVAEDEVAILEWTSTGSMADGRPVSYRGVSVIEFGPDGIKNFRTYFDPRKLKEKAE